ncbi:DEAD/DEAH box helicase [Rhodococcus erythropolis]|nr:DEAD/DEAH box helicase [Rhodococcus erythropolis]
MPDTSNNLDSIATFERLREAFFRYYDSPFGLQDERLQRERRDLLDRPGGVYQRPLIEVRPQYVSSGHSLPQSVAEAKLNKDVADFLASGLIPPDIQLHRHQEQSLIAGMRAGRNVVVTAGTGSGKTESFLLPVIASLVEESESWGGAGAGESPRWWATPGQVFTPQRQGETGRRAAVRTMILYPMNALVDDQLIRLRKALDSEDARSWLDRKRNGHRFYFGRYTGATPVTGAVGEDNARRELIRYLADTEKLAAQAARSGDPEQRFFVPRLGGAEMISRWDIAHSAPDILITNYSMLNIMLLRDRDAHLFQSTKEWLFADPGHRFTLVVDELHSYRGTSGTEVALLIRNLKHRLGITDHPEKFRVIAASASLDATRDSKYLEEFFGIDADSFDFFEGDVQRPTISTLDVTSDPAVALENAFWTDSNGNLTDRAEAKSEAQLAKTLFPDDSEDSLQSVRNLLRRVGEPEFKGPKLRSHMFFRNVPGIWACTDPNCGHIPGGAYDDRTVGQLFAEPRTRCDCGSRVLELLYCQNCGDVLLGGFTTQGSTLKPRVQLLADIPELDKIPDRVSQERSANNYLVYWPRHKRPELDDPNFEWTIDGVSFGFSRAILTPSTGELKAVKTEHTGWSFRIQIPSLRRRGTAKKPAIEPSRLSAMPNRCPNCSDDWGVPHKKNSAVAITDPLRLRSPIRGMRTGFEKINQVLITELAQQMPANDKKLIVFTDSRQDAAKLSSGISLRHYQDLVRILLLDSLAESQISLEDIAAAKRFVSGADKSDEAQSASKLLRARDAQTFNLLRDIWTGMEPDITEAETATIERRFSGPATLVSLRQEVRDKLLTLGVNPAGPKVSLSETAIHSSTRGIDEKVTRWPSIFDWRGSGAPSARGSLGSAEQTLLDNIETALREEFLNGLFSSAGRDFESLGLGWLALKSDNAPDDVEASMDIAFARSSLRVLGDMRRFALIRTPALAPPRKLKEYWRKLAVAHSMDPDDVALRVTTQWGDGVRDFLIEEDQTVLRTPGAGWWTCGTCHRPHLHRGAGLCTRCHRPLPVDTVEINVSEDYYGWKASHAIGRFRLNAAELTGQTDRADAQSRQARFQEVFLDETENPLADGVDLLSVTTTMEAGVDIGALEAVVLGNMPPSRFNYQQRVGRAGRRGTPVAVALTVCRGRSHDEYYFDRPERITNDPTPKPYLALDQEAILYRTLTAESLRMAFAVLPVDLDGYTGVGTNTHGQFGEAASWPIAKPYIADWLSDNSPAITAAANALSDRSALRSNCAEYVKRIQDELVDDIDEIVKKPGADDLSQRLAEHGLLPMFGFPSKVRNLYLKKPTRTYPWPPKKTIDRDSSMAVSQFAPTSELVRDGSVYPAVGIAAYRKAGPRVLPESNPLGLLRHLDLCRSCSYIVDRGAAAVAQTGPCPQCGADAGTFETIPMREPLGYVAGKKRDFDGNFSWSTRSTSARAVSDLGDLDPVTLGDTVAYSGRGDRYVINDRGGNLFEFKPSSGTSPWDGAYLSVDAAARDMLWASDLGGTSIRTALGSVQPTDLMFLGINRSTHDHAGLRLNLDTRGRQPSGVPDTSEGRRAAWYSLAFLIRTVAASYLDMQPHELNAGIFSGMEGGEPAVFAFIADTLENGAGFSTHLGSEAELPNFLAAVGTYVSELSNADHASICTSSCYRCLRDYANMSFHALLDWRLAADLFALLSGNPLASNLPAEVRALNKWTEGNNAHVVDGLRAPVAAAICESVGSRIGIIVRHPFEAAEEGGLMSPRLAQAFDEIGSRLEGDEPVFAVDSFVLDRSPAEVFRLADLVPTRYP